MSTRLQTGGRLLNKDVPLNFTFNGRKMQGYEGDPCGECGNYTLVRNGTCMKCNTCGGTSGCS
mgnify:CR=1 FL=1